MSLEAIRKLRETNIRKYGSYEAWKAEMRKRAVLGGKAQVPKGFAMNKELASEAGKKGSPGSKSIKAGE